LFQDAAANLMHLYKESIKRSEESYYQGKEDAYEEVLKWFLGYNNGNFKHVSANEFFNYISQKLQDHRGGKRKGPQANQNSNIQQQINSARRETHYSS
jgi:hypothetical protein